jgi:hypothetical protein
LRYTYPVTGGNTFKPGNPATDQPEESRRTTYEDEREYHGLDTPEGRDAWDARFDQDQIKRTIAENRYWERARFQAHKSLRGRKREIEREARKDEARKRV